MYADDVNTYLREITGRDVTAKDFRTWTGTMIAAESLREKGAASTKRDAERNVLRAIDHTAERLGNTRAVCRKYYIHPALIEAYLEGAVLPPLSERLWQERRPHGPTLRRHEAEVLAFLKARVSVRRPSHALPPFSLARAFRRQRLHPPREHRAHHEKLAAGPRGPPNNYGDYKTTHGAPARKARKRYFSKLPPPCDNPEDRRERGAGKKAEEAEEEGKGNVGGAETHDE